MPIALLTDFGLADAYVGVLKAVIASIHPKASVLDLAHEIPPHDRVHAGLLLYQAYKYFPKKTIFVAVIDPGVGGARKPLLIQTKDYFFIGPDNGVFTMALEEEAVQGVFHLTRDRYFLKPVSRTFHGRDIFAPVAAHLAKGIAPRRLGQRIGSWMKLQDLAPAATSKFIMGKILSVDRFGNAVTNLKKNYLRKYFPKMDFRLFRAGGRTQGSPLRLKTHYAEGKAGEPLLLFGSSDLLEIAVNCGSAAQRLKLKAGDQVKIPL